MKNWKKKLKNFPDKSSNIENENIKLKTENVKKDINNIKINNFSINNFDEYELLKNMITYFKEVGDSNMLMKLRDIKKLKIDGSQVLIDTKETGFDDDFYNEIDKYLKIYGLSIKTKNNKIDKKINEVENIFGQKLIVK